jgi:hypothetical protein
MVSEMTSPEHQATEGDLVSANGATLRRTRLTPISSCCSALLSLPTQLLPGVHLASPRPTAQL